MKATTILKEKRTALRLLVSSIKLINVFSYLKFAIFFVILLYTSWKLMDPSIIETAHAISPADAMPTAAECDMTNNYVELDEDCKPIKPKEEYHVIDFKKAPYHSFMIAVMGPICALYWIWWIYENSK